MNKALIIGACGRMGRTLIRCLAEGRVEGMNLGGAVDISGCPEQGSDAGTIAGTHELRIPVTSDLPAIIGHNDVAIDFSARSGTAGIGKCIADAGKTWVIGTTGLGDKETEAIERAAEKIPVVLAPNMSLGVNLLFLLVEEAARALKGKGYDMEIVERHHRRKKDAPSGTALGLGLAAAQGADLNLDEVAVHGRQGFVKSDRPADQIGFHAIRGGDFVGDHTMIFATDGECVELSHRATSRETFAMGALRAADWVRTQTPGLYTMRDVLGL